MRLWYYMLQHVDVFSGIGGFTLALRDVSRPVLYCEIDKDAQAVLRHQMANGSIGKAPIVPDVTNLRAYMKGKRVPDILTAGFPCDGMSSAGLKQGLKHPETALIGEVIKLLETVQIPLVILENSPSMKTESGFSKRFARMGYEWVSTTACAYIANLPQRRNRWFAVYALNRQVVSKLATSLSKLDARSLRGAQTEPERTVRTAIGWNMFARRYALLGRVIVPACMRMVLVFLSQAWLQGHRRHMEYPGVEHPDLHLVIQHGSLKLHRSLWPTPRSSNPGTCNILNARIAGDLPSAVKFEQNTKAGQLSLQWVEWLQGFPKGWTACLQRAQ